MRAELDGLSLVPNLRRFLLPREGWIYPASKDAHAVGPSLIGREPSNARMRGIVVLLTVSTSVAPREYNRQWH